MHDPTFMVIGAQKCGTTWLQRMLSQHPGVVTSTPKELHFFNRRDRYIKGFEWYRSHFHTRAGVQAVGEFTPNYLWNSPLAEEVERFELIENVAPLVRDAYPQIRLVVSLRDPVERAISSYHHQILRRRVSPGAPITEVMDRYGIFGMGRYLEQIDEWLGYFDRSQFLFLIYEDDIKNNRQQTLERVFDFIGADRSFRSADIDTHVNARRGALYRRLHYVSPTLANRLAKTIPAVTAVDWPPIRVTDDERSELKRQYRGVNNGLDQLIGRPIEWLRYY